MLKKRTWKKRIHQGFCCGEYPDKKFKKLKRLYNKHNHGVVFEYGVCDNFGVCFRVFSAKPKRNGVRIFKYRDALAIKNWDVKPSWFRIRESGNEP